MKKKLIKKIFIVGITSALLSVTTASTVGASTYLDVFKTAVWKLLKAGSNSLINVKGQTEYDTGWVRKSTGGFKFNSGNNGASVKIKCNLASDNMDFDAFPYTDALHWAEKLSYILTSPRNVDVISKTLSHNQYAYFSSKAPYGVYTARFVEDSSIYWNCYTIFTDWSDSFTDGTRRKANDSTSNKPYVIKDSTQQVYFVPSLPHTVSVKKNRTSDILDTNMLLKQFYDTGIQNYVTSLRDYNVGDELIFNDIINEVTYDSQKGCTYISFDSMTGDVSWPFSGDLTSRFSAGSRLSLKFEVVEDFTSNGIIFENIDYFVDGYIASQNNRYLPIDKYLIA